VTAPLVLSLFDRTGVMVKPWLEAGYRCMIVDIQHPKGEHTDGLLTTVGADLTSWLPPLTDYRIAFAFPPCTHLAKSGARWMQDKGLPALIEGLTLVESARRICEWTGAPYLIENPSGTLSTYWRKPDHSFDPHEYGGYLPNGGDAYTKRTCLWTGGGFRMPPRKPVEPVDGSKMHRLGPSPERANLRSVTPEGFARAVFAANHGAPLPEQFGHEGQPDLFGGAA
jgi:hypothetical protein